MGSQDGHDHGHHEQPSADQHGHDEQHEPAPTLTREDSHAGSIAASDTTEGEFAEASEGGIASSSPAIDQQATTRAETDNQTLAALAASSSSSLPLSPDGPAGSHTPQEVDPNSPSFILVASLRSQITDLTSQVTSLNSKLVRSYTSVGDLEDEVHERREAESRAVKKVKELEEDKLRWEREIERGGWVERDHVSGEMQRLMSKVLEETASRETAVEAHTALETEIDTLTSSLFDEANKMVVVERVARARAEEKMRSLEEAETNLRSMFEEVQVQLREEVEAKEEMEKELVECRLRMKEAGVPLPSSAEEGEGEAVEKPKNDSVVAFSDGESIQPILTSSLALDPFNPPLSPSQYASPRLLTTVLPYHEFLAFIHHLRQLRLQVLSKPVEHPAYPHPYTSTASSLAHRGFGNIPNPQSTTVTQTTLITPPSPAQLLAPHLLLSSHLSQPFLKRCVEEDSDPTLRLDLAPGLGFLSRRTVGTAIVDGTLSLEPFFASGPGAELPSDKCALCGCGLERWSRGAPVMKSTVAAQAATGVNSTMKKMLGGGGWGFGKSSNSGSGSGATTPPASSSSNALPASPTKTSFPATSDSFALPSYSSSAPPSNEHIHIFRPSDAATSSRYAICPVYCLARLRAVCEFWTYVRVIERGLLLEEGFRFVKGRGGKPEGGLRSASQSVEGLGLSGDGVVGGGGKSERVTVIGGEEKGVFGGGVRRESLQLNAGAVPTEFVMDGGELPVSKEEDEEEEEEGEGAEKEPQVVVEQPSESAEQPKAEEEQKQDNGDAQSGQASNAEDKSTAHSSPEVAQSPNPNKPPVPKRSAARQSGSTTPVLGSSPSSPTVDTHQASEAPQLPPRRAPAAGLAPPAPPPRHPTMNRSTSDVSTHSHTNGDIVGASMGWEDRCWSEVIRLKESVFWARMAAVAADGEQVASRLAKVEGGH